MTRYTLADGREVEHNNPLARWERECIEAHMRDLRRMDSSRRRLQLEDIERSMGRAFRQKLSETYAKDWAERKARANEALR
jgi:hypothetical protein